MVASSKKYLLILSRKPELKNEVLGRLLEKAIQLGFDTGRLYFTPQTGGCRTVA
jgi:apolipoprotein D and lipocalin family protein